jgi:hypothetical protein
MADFPTRAPAGYDDLFPCPEGDQALANGEDALKTGNLTLARKLQQDAVDFYTEAFALSKNLAAIESLDQRIGTATHSCHTSVSPPHLALAVAAVQRAFTARDRE